MGTRHFIILLSLLCIFSCQNTSPPPSNTPSKIELELDSLIQSEYKAERFHGTILISKNDDILYKKAVGTANRIWDISMELDYCFDIASLNKSFIAMLVLIAVEEGKLSLNDKLSDLLSNYPYQGKFNNKVTLHQMLTHTSGLPDYDAVADPSTKEGFKEFKRLHFSNKDYINFISLLPPVSEPDTRFYYSNFAYHLMPIILEEIYAKSFNETLQEKICNPLQLSATFNSDSNEEVLKHVVEAYNYSKEEDKWRRNNFIDLTLGRRIFSNVNDLYKWGKAMQGNTLISDSLLQAMLTNHTAHITQDVSYGYGWVIFDGQANYKMGNLSINRPYIIHGGATEGYKSMLINVNHGEYIITFLSNVGQQTNEILLAKKIVTLLNLSDNEN